MSTEEVNNQTNNATDDVIVQTENVDEEMLVKDEYVPPVYEISATDHINKSLLEKFKNRIENGEVRMNDDEQNDGNDEDWQ